MAGLVGSVVNRLFQEPKHVEDARVPTSTRTVAGVAITPDMAVTIPAVWACLRYLSQTVGVLPWHVMLQGSSGPTVALSHPVDWLLWKRPSAEWSSFQFRETMLHWALRWGNGYAEIERSVGGQPIALWPIHPSRCELCREEDGGDLYLEVSNGSNGKIEIPYEDVFHLRGFGEGPVGVNVIHYASQSLGWARAAQLFGASFFGNGTNLGGVITQKGKRGLSKDALQAMKAEFRNLYRGPGRANDVAVLDAEMEYKQLGIEPDKAQFILTHQFLVEEICRWFGVPPHKVMHLLRATFSNIEHQAIEVVVDSISPWAKRFEDEADFKLFGGNRRGYYTKMNMNALMRGDAKSRVEFYRGMREIGVYSANHILELEDENTIGPDGDKHTMQQSYTTIERIGEESAAPAPAPLAADPEPQADPLPANVLAEYADVMAMVGGARNV